MAEGDDVKAGGAAAGTGAAGAAAAAAGGASADAGKAGGGAPPLGADGKPPAGAAAGETQTPEQIAAAATAKAAADATEAARVATLTPEQKAAEAKAAADKAAADAPPDYTGLKLAEGWKADDPMVAEALKIFGDHKLTPDGAQKLIEFTATRDKALATAINDANAANWQKQSGEWKAATDKEFSPEDLGGGKTAAAQVFDKETLAYLEGLGFTNHPGFVRGMVKVSKAIKDDTWVSGNAPNGSAGRTAQQMFPKSNHNP